jgi:hypothetical protein
MNILKKKKWTGTSLAIAFSLLIGSVSSWDTKALANSDVGTKLQNDADDAKRDTKKTGRKAKKKVRDATGHGSVKKDAEDSVNNLKDDVSTEGKKLKRGH